ncbi:MAG: NADH-quinone oxidoreductase subunit N [Armatimonadetes bacterium]|nr:NADH-quinone oxidoreductase subunit N [Armatimonadota bacterium]
MHIGDIKLIFPAIYMSAAAIVVLILGVIAARRPGKGLDHWLPSHYLAPVLVFSGLFFSAAALIQSFAGMGLSIEVPIGSEMTRAPAVALFVTSGGHAQLTVDPFAAIFTFIAFAGTLIVMLISLDHFGERQPHKAEYYSILMFATAAVSFAASATDLIAIYLSIEFLSLTSYVLAAFAKTDRRSGEAGLKYFLYGAACSAIGLYGMSILFGVTGGSTALTAVARGLEDARATGAAWVGVVFTLVGFGFKLALVPFHFWAPDTYEGAPTPVAAFLSVVSKAAGLAVMTRFLTIVAAPDEPVSLSWYWILVVLTAVSMFYGNLVAIPQRNIKRMLAYSSIAQVGYLMIGVLTAMHSFGGPGRLLSGFFGVPSAAVRSDVANLDLVTWDMQGVLIYTLAYLFMNLGAFAVVSVVGKKNPLNPPLANAEAYKGSEIENYSGLMRRSPFYATSLTVFLISLAGVPPTAGFVGKLFIFGGAIRMGTSYPELIVLAIIGVINSVISAYYYLNVVRLMFFAPAEGKSEISASIPANTAIAICLVTTLALIVVVKPVASLMSSAIYSVVPGVIR